MLTPGDCCSEHFQHRWNKDDRQKDARFHGAAWTAIQEPAHGPVCSVNTGGEHQFRTAYLAFGNRLFVSTPEAFANSSWTQRDSHATLTLSEALVTAATPCTRATAALGTYKHYLFYTPWQQTSFRCRDAVLCGTGPESRFIWWNPNAEFQTRGASHFTVPAHFYT